MKFPYTKVLDFPNHQRRYRYLPWIRFGISNTKKEAKILYPLGLVDSGSEISFIDYEIGEELGFDIKSGKRDRVYGVGGGSIEVYFHNAIFYIDNTDGDQIIYDDLIAFTREKFPSTMPQQTAILGTIGFFRHLSVFFKYPKFIEITRGELLQ